MTHLKPFRSYLHNSKKTIDTAEPLHCLSLKLHTTRYGFVESIQGLAAPGFGDNIKNDMNSAPFLSDIPIHLLKRMK